MNTKIRKDDKKEKITAKRRAEIMAKLMASSQKVDLSSKEAELNKYSMNDNNGKRIIYLVIDKRTYLFTGNRKKVLELLKLVDGQLKPISIKKKPLKSRKRLVSR